MDAFEGPGALVMIVDDDPDIRELMTDTLEGEGYRVASAANGDTALQLLRGLPELPRPILLDLKMPGMGGVEFRDHLLKDPRLASIPLALFSAAGRLNVPDGVEHLPKPVRLATVLELVKRYTR